MTLFLLNRDPKIVLLEAIDDYDHNICVYKEKGMYGSIAKSGYPNGEVDLTGRPPVYPTLSELVRSYQKSYGFTPGGEATLRGYSEEIDLKKKFGTQWMTTINEELWNIYHLYIDTSVQFYDLRNPNEKPHLHPFVKAIKEGWIQFERGKHVRLRTNRMPKEAQQLVREYLANGGIDGKRSIKRQTEINNKFLSLTGMTVSHLLELRIYDADDYFKSGYRREDL